jgi:hypothetical protein
MALPDETCFIISNETPTDFGEALNPTLLQRVLDWTEDKNHTSGE